MKAIFYKEWLKVRWYFILAIATSLGFSIFSILRINRVIELKGAGHIWEVMIQRDVIFIDLMQFVPIIMGICMAIVQFAPEMYHKSLKLTLHLPYSALKMTFVMLFSGFLLLLGTFFINMIVMNGYLSIVLAPELKWQILNTATVWYLAGIASYFLIAWIVFEPAWKRRLLNIGITLLLLKIFFMSDMPQAYNSFLPYLAIGSILIASLSWLSILRFKAGKQD